MGKGLLAGVMLRRVGVYCEQEVCRDVKKSYWKGSYTVEGSVVVTMTILVLAALILCTFYIHDRAVFQSMVCETASAGSNFATDSERKEAVSAMTDRLKASRFLGSRNLSGNAATGSKEITVFWNADYPMPGFALNYLSADDMTIQKSWTCKILNPADAIRKIKGAVELLTGGND